MTEEVKAIAEERAQNLHDVYDNKIPKRVPIDVSLSLCVIADYGKVDRKSAYWDPSLLRDAADELCSLIPSDSLIYGGTVYTPVSSQALDSLNKVMSDTGYMQHPNTQCMEEDEYDDLIEDAYAFIIDKCIPRVYKNLDPSVNPGREMFALLQEASLKGKVAAKEMPMRMQLSDKYGYPAGAFGGFGRAAMDWIGDQLRSFSGVLMDVRRHRAKLIEALEAVYPLMYYVGLQPDPNNVNRYACTNFQLHMATYLREKDFAEVWYPTWRRQVDDYASLGMRSFGFMEHDYTRLLDYMQETPTGSVYQFEYTDPKLLKEKMGKKHILTGGFPLEHLRNCTKDEIIDKTKAWLDIMAPDGQYIFGFDKGAVTLGDINLENLIAVCETVKEYGVYDNPGAPTGELFNKADYNHSEVAPLRSKYLPTWEQYLAKYPNTPDNAKDLIMGSEIEMFKTLFLMSC